MRHRLQKQLLLQAALLQAAAVAAANLTLHHLLPLHKQSAQAGPLSSDRLQPQSGTASALTAARSAKRLLYYSNFAENWT
jgi:hypothetical protein